MFLKIIALASTLLSGESYFEKGFDLSGQQSLHHYTNASFECPVETQQYDIEEVSKPHAEMPEFPSVAEKLEDQVKINFQEPRPLSKISYDSRAVRGFVVDMVFHSDKLDDVLEELDSIESLIHDTNFLISVDHDGKFDFALRGVLGKIKKSSSIIHNLLKTNYPTTARELTTYILNKTLPLHKALGVPVYIPN